MRKKIMVTGRAVNVKNINVDKIFKSSIIYRNGIYNRFYIEKRLVNAIVFEKSHDGEKWEDGTVILYTIHNPLFISVINANNSKVDNGFLAFIIEGHRDGHNLIMAISTTGEHWYKKTILKSSDIGVDEINSLYIVEGLDYINVYLKTKKDNKKALFMVEINKFDVKGMLMGRYC